MKDTRHLFRDGLPPHEIMSYASRLFQCRTWIVGPCTFRTLTNIKTTAIERSKKARLFKIERRLKWSEGQADQDLNFGQGNLVEIQVSHIEHLQVTWDRVKIPTRSFPNTVKFSINSIPPRILEIALLTGSQGEEEIEHENGLPLR